MYEGINSLNTVMKEYASQELQNLNFTIRRPVLHISHVFLVSLYFMFSLKFCISCTFVSS